MRPARGTGTAADSAALPVMVGDDGCEGTHADPVTHQVDVFAEELLTPAPRTESISPSCSYQGHSAQLCEVRRSHFTSCPHKHTSCLVVLFAY